MAFANAQGSAHCEPEMSPLAPLIYPSVPLKKKEHVLQQVGASFRPSSKTYLNKPVTAHVRLCSSVIAHGSGAW